MGIPEVNVSSYMLWRKEVARCRLGHFCNVHRISHLDNAVGCRDLSAVTKTLKCFFDLHVSLSSLSVGDTRREWVSVGCTRGSLAQKRCNSAIATRNL